MSGTDATIRVKLGQLEVEYQGDASFLKDGLFEAIKELLELQKQHPVPQESATTGSRGAGTSGVTFALSTDTIATILGAASGPDLVIAAAAHLHFVKAKSTFTRQEMIDEMRTAPGHFRETYINNLSKYLNTLRGKDRLRLVTSPDTYALSNKEKQVLEAKLAEDQ
jgi:hypothetical protein